MFLNFFFLSFGDGFTFVKSRVRKCATSQSHRELMNGCWCMYKYEEAWNWGLCLEVHMILGGEFILCSRVSKSWRIEMWVG
jgi:hypothetical protein